MSSLPDKYAVDYMIYMVSNSIEEEEHNWNTDYRNVIKRLLFKKFDAFVEERFLKDG